MSPFPPTKNGSTKIRGVNGSRSNSGKQWFKCLWSSVVDHEYFRSSMVCQQFLLLFSWPQFREVCLNYEVVMFQPRTGTPPYLGSVTNCYIAILL